MPLSWNEIRHNAIRFSNEWTGETREHAEAKTFWDDFFSVFGIRRRTVASFEEPVKKLSGDYGYIDLFWPGVLIVEHKSFGKDLSNAESQAYRYAQDLARDPERPKKNPPLHHRLRFRAHRPARSRNEFDFTSTHNCVEKHNA
jgi:hypothetical protein